MNMFTSVIKEYAYTGWVLFFISLGILLVQPWFFALASVVVLYMLWTNSRRYFLWAYFIVLTFYGSYSLFGIEPLFAPPSIKLGKDAIWILFLLFAFARMPIDWNKVQEIPRYILYPVIAFIIYVIAHVIFVAPTLSQKALELRYYLEYLPLLFIPLAFQITHVYLKKNFIEFMIISIYVALFALVQNQIPGITVLGQYRVNATLPNYFHMAMYISTMSLITATVVLARLKESFSWMWVLFGISVTFLFSFIVYLSDSRGLVLAYLGTWTLFSLALVVWHRWILSFFLTTLVALAVFFTMGPDWAFSRYQSMYLQLFGNSTTVTTDQILDPNLTTNERVELEGRSVDKSVVQRLNKAQEGFTFIRENPIAGYSLLLTSENLNTAFASDVFLMDMAVHLGVTGVVLFLAIIFAVVSAMLLFYFRNSQNSYPVLVVIAVLGIIGQYLVGSLTTSSWIAFPVNALFWFWVGIGLLYTFSRDGADRTTA